ncbi:carbon-nitrogen hydrolase [Hymenopellis radicata]|nr:carbon-nitrogen hydrolase [Hymenopellis radicata]
MDSRPTRKLRVSVVQACCQKYDLDATLEKLEQLTRLAKDRDGAQLAVFPEAFIGGYPKTSTFGSVVGDRSADGRNEYVRYHAAAIEVPSPAVSRIEAISKATGVFLVIGIIERDGGTLYCCQIFVDPDQGYLGKHRKLAPTAVERIIWGQGDGSTLPVIEQQFISAEGTAQVQTKISGAICWENYMPLLRYYYYSKGTELYCASTVDSRPVWQSSMVHIALEGRCFVLSACQYAEEKDYPEGHAVYDDSARHPDNVMLGGGSVIVNPLGQVLAGPLLKGEGVLTATIDLDDCIRGKFDLDVVGHYARPDVFGFTANVA